jgi:hypothetical protein
VKLCRTRSFGGSGLGLFISHQLARLMGGQLQFHRDPSITKGSIFILNLPLDNKNEHSCLEQTRDERQLSPEFRLRFGEGFSSFKSDLESQPTSKLNLA